MFMKSHIFFLLLCVSLILTGCPYEHSRVTVEIKNESTDTIVVACGFDKHEKEYTLNCDTILHNKRDMYDIHMLNLMAMRMFWEYMKMSYKTPSLCFSLTNKFMTCFHGMLLLTTI